MIAKDTTTSDGFQGTGFSGCFDGSGHVIRNLTITTDRTGTRYGFLGLFGQIETAGVVKHLSLEDVSIKGSSQADYFGGIAANCKGRIEDCHASGSVSYQWYLLDPVSCDYIGGIAGNVEGGADPELRFRLRPSAEIIMWADWLGEMRERLVIVEPIALCRVTIMSGACRVEYKGTVQDSSSKGIGHRGRLHRRIDRIQFPGTCQTMPFVRFGHGWTGCILGNLRGGLIGQCYLSQIDDCFATGAVMPGESKSTAGGLIGKEFEINAFPMLCDRIRHRSKRRNIRWIGR